ncbi:MAG TPA: MarR family winged helix-turn-helix transcriptional regulator [Solirubrobacteraceae bacterium]|jgi:DNA-binding MarR family transcriptional regulator/GNAT superfamily N-acetyltransferase|nr:MarR family winged helix-turn-helix transcriptional regulator [Solirubrobacteraceae bacterium]
MSDATVDQVRRFSRVVTERVGALNERFLGQERPLGEARLLWEIGLDGCEVRLLRGRLGLDSGYLSRLLRSLEAAGLVKVTLGRSDRRIRVARLTAAGHRERGALDRRSDELAQSLLAPLSPKQRERLLAAMHDVERLLTASSVQLTVVDPEHPDAQYCLAEYVTELNRRSERGFDPSVGATALPHEVRPPAGEFFVAYLQGEPVGCGAVKHHADAPAEIKRMWIAPKPRGLGLGRRLLERLEACALAGGARVARIETSAALLEALSLYRSTGWVEVSAFNDEPFADHWFEKALT